MPGSHTQPRQRFVLNSLNPAKSVPVLPSAGTIGTIHRVAFQVTPQMVQRFVALTADRSSLHTDEAFGRRCLYRRNVAQGMLPLLFIAALEPGLAGGVIKRMAARFIKPVFPYDRLELIAQITGMDPAQDLCEVEFRLLNQDSAMVVTTGSLALGYGQGLNQATGDGAQAPMIHEPLEEQCALLDAIAKGHETEFAFEVTPAHVQTLLAMLPATHVPAEPCDLANLLGTSLLSTLVGMRMPGKFAVFLDFQLAFHQQLRWNQRYLVKAKVTFKSESASTVVQTVSFHEAGDHTEVATGKVSSQVYPPPPQMPALAALKAQDSDLGLKGKVVLVTGASRGIGETTAKLFAVHGAKVALNYFRGRQDAERIVEEITAHGGSAIALEADVANRQQVRQMLQSLWEQFQSLDVLVNNAVDNLYPAGFLNLSWDSVQRDLDVILKGAFHCCQEAIPLMLKKGRGKIINVSSIATEVPPPNQAKLVVAKSALEGLSRSLAVEFASQNIQVNMVVPSLVETDLTQHLSKVFLDGSRHDTPMKRLATPVDVARAVVFLASSLASFTTGQKLRVTGGSPPFL